jgi:membrane protein YdbS with pleckstrin-like domain
MIDFDKRLTQIRNTLIVLLPVTVVISLFVAEPGMYALPLGIIISALIIIVHTVRFIMFRYMEYREEKYSDVDYQKIVDEM